MQEQTFDPQSENCTPVDPEPVGPQDAVSAATPGQIEELKTDLSSKSQEVGTLAGQLDKVQALNDQYKDWVNRLQKEKAEL